MQADNYQIAAIEKRMEKRLEDLESHFQGKILGGRIDNLDINLKKIWGHDWRKNIFH